MTQTAHFVAADLGASSGRVMLGQWDGRAFSVEELHRFANGGVRAGDGLYWDFPGIWSGIREGLAKCHACCPQPPQGVAVDAWGVDFGLLDGAGQLARSTEALRAYRAEAVVAGGCLFRVNALYGLIGERPGVMQATLVAGWPYAATVLDIAAAMGIVRRTRVGASFGLEMIKGHGARRPLR